MPGVQPIGTTPWPLYLINQLGVLSKDAENQKRWETLLWDNKTDVTESFPVNCLSTPSLRTSSDTNEWNWFLLLEMFFSFRIVSIKKSKRKCHQKLQRKKKRNFGESWNNVLKFTDFLARFHLKQKQNIQIISSNYISQGGNSPNFLRKIHKILVTFRCSYETTNHRKEIIYDYQLLTSIFNDICFKDFF